MTITLEMLWWRLYPYPPFHCINIVLIIDDLTVVKTTISRKELSDMPDISLISTTKNQTESFALINKSFWKLFFSSRGKKKPLACQVRPTDESSSSQRKKMSLYINSLLFLQGREMWLWISLRKVVRTERQTMSVKTEEPRTWVRVRRMAV